jgi:mono/diheme cytochrome c family protein/glucose/arabinose dehydrogenase
MVLNRFRAIAVLVMTAAVTGLGYQSSPSNRPWPPGVQPWSGESPVLPPEEALKTFFMPPGYRVELVASEPLIQEPVAIDWDVDGRLWAVEMPGFMANLTGSNEYDPIGRVVVLEDENGDGRMDKRTIFADGLVLARSLKVLDRGVLVGEPPNAWLMQDTDGDLRMDRKELVTDQYGRRETDPQNNANGFQWSLDNVMHTAGQSDIELRLKDGKFEVLKTLRRGEWGVTHDDGGRIYRNTNESALHVDFVQTAYFARNPNLLRTRGSYERLATGNEDLNIVWPVRPNPGTNRAYQFGIDRPDGTLAKFTSVCGPVVYRGDRLPAELYGNVFVGEPAANLVGRLVLEDTGTTLSARKAYERGEFLASTDERFRPVNFSSAPDGTLYVVDMYRGIIEHKISTTVYLRDQIVARKLDQATGQGRIYRVMHESTKRDTTTKLSSSTPAPGGGRAGAMKGSPEELVALLSHPNGWWRDTAQRLLVERGPRSAVPALVKLADSAPDWRTRLHALWTLDGLDAVQPATIERALQDSARDVRASAVRISERWLGDASHPLQSAVMKRIEDGDWAVRRQLAASIGVLPPGRREAAAADFLDRHASDPVAVDSLLSGLRGSEPAVLEKMLAGAETAQRDTAITVLAATIMRGAQETAIQNLLAWIGDGKRAAWQRTAMLRGAEGALLGAALPGSPGRATNSMALPGAPCPTCPGGRAGPGGAYAFRTPATVVPTGGGRGGPARIRLNREPVALTALAATQDEAAGRATALLERISWPGKPGEEAVVPLTPEEQRRYEAGAEVYRNLCQSCHQPDGRGQDRIAPALVGSAFALGPPEITARILLHGKEGPIGLMPPIGAAITDEQIASVLTYIRREWGQTGNPVHPATVTTVRKSTGDRTRPWTEAELKALQ